MRGLASAFLFLLFLFPVASCSRSSTESASKGKIKIGVIPKGTTHEFWKAIHAGALKAGSELEADIIWKGPVREDDREDQIKVVEDLITLGVTGVVLAPLDNKALRVPVRNAARSGIPVVIIDSGLNCDDYESFIATDNYRGGKLAGRELAKLIEGRGNVVMLRYQEGSASTMDRERGFLDSIAEFDEIEVVSSNQYGGATTETAYRASENLIAQFKKGEDLLSISGIFTPNESTTFGMLRALKDGGLAGMVKFVGFDSSKKLVEGLRSGDINALVLQDPMEMGYLGVKTLVSHLQGAKVRKKIDTSVTLVTLDNMKEPAIRDLLEPDFHQWLK
jgi:ribose transport system substrate-binding protein